jgi:surface antigen
MPPKTAKNGTNSQTQRAIALTQAESLEPTSQQDAETQADVDTQVDEDASSSSAADDGLASTADGAAASTANTTHTSADEADTMPTYFCTSYALNHASQYCKEGHQLSDPARHRTYAGTPDTRRGLLSKM